MILNLRTSVYQKSLFIVWKVHRMKEDILYTQITKEQFLEYIKLPNKSVTTTTKNAAYFKIPTDG